jgi:hypothetical protein
MSESDSPSRRRPPTIDLTATEVQTEAPASGQQAEAEAKAEFEADGAAAKPAAARSPRPFKAALIGALAGAVVIAAAGTGLWFTGYLPTPQQGLPPVAQQQPAEAGPSASNPAAPDIAGALKRIEGAIQAQKPDAALASRLAAAEAAVKAQTDALAALARRVDEVAAAAQTALAEAKAASDAADAAKSAAKSTAQPEVARSDLDALAGRIAALEAAVKAVSETAAQNASSADDRVARLIVATEALRANVERGAPFQAELAAAKALGAAADATAPLEPFAASGVPSAAALAHDLATLLPALQQAAAPAPGAGDNSFLRRLEANAKQLVRVTPVDAPPGDDAASVVARINVDAAHADVAGAIADIAKLPDAVAAPAAAWVQKAKAREAAIVAARHLAATALAALGPPQ